MIKNEQAKGFLKAAAIHAAVSVLLISVQFLAASLLIYGAYKAAWLVLGDDAMRIPSRAYDAAGFALITVVNSVTQYLLGCLLALSQHLGSRARYSITAVSAAIACAFFVDMAAASALGAYSMAWLPPLFSFVLGGIMGLSERRETNPWRDSRFRLFN